MRQLAPLPPSQSCDLVGGSVSTVGVGFKTLLLAMWELVFCQPLDQDVELLQPHISLGTAMILP